MSEHIYRKKHEGREYGSWFVWWTDPDSRRMRHMSLGTKDRDAAARIAREKLASIRAAAQARASEPPASSAPQTPPPTPVHPDAYAPPPSPPPPTNGAPPRRTAADIFASWAGGPGSGPTNGTTQGAAPAADSRIVRGLAQACTMMSIAGAALMVRALGVEPARHEDGDAELLEAGWELQWQEWLVNRPPQPWMLIAAGTASIAFGMWSDGTPIPKKQKPLEEGGGKAS